MKTLGLILILLFVLGCAIGTGCGNGEDETANPTNTPTSTPTPSSTEDNMVVTIDEDKCTALEIFKYIPIELQRARYINLAVFREDVNLQPFYDEIVEEVGDNLAASGIVLDEIDHLGFVGGRAALPDHRYACIPRDGHRPSGLPTAAPARAIFRKLRHGHEMLGYAAGRPVVPLHGVRHRPQSPRDRSYRLRRS